MRLPIATFVNVATVSLGCLLGLYLQQLFSIEYEKIIFQAIGLGTLIIGIMMGLRVPDGYMLIFILSLILGGITGEALGVDDFLNGLGETLKTTLSIGDAQFTEGLVTAFLLFCVGSMVIIGAIEEGVEGKRNLLLIKSILDGVASVALTAAYGVGVWFSVIPLLLFQGGLTLLAGKLAPFFTDNILNQITAVGGVLIVAISIRMMKLGEVNIENLLPSLVFVVVMTVLYDRFRPKVDKEGE
jgi:uncharacterized membrane protein YqgA involved in biofilm formation